MSHHDKPTKPDEFTADLERDSKGEAQPLRNVPVEEEYVADPEAHHQHSRKGQAESPRELTLNQPEHKKHGK